MLMQFDPFREFDRLAEQLAAGARTPRPFPMDAYRRGDEFVVSFDLPGMAPGTIDLTVEQNVLTIKAERRFDGQEGDEVIAAERPLAGFSRVFMLIASGFNPWRPPRRTNPRTSPRRPRTAQTPSYPAMPNQARCFMS